MKLIGSGTAHVGFSLVEVTLSLVIIIIIAVVSIPIFFSQQHKSDLDSAIDGIAQHIRRAQVLSQSMTDDRTWGIRIQTGTITVFQGNSYIGRNTLRDEITAISPAITLSGLNEIIFAKRTGLPQSNGVITLTTTDDQQRFLTINQRGMVAYD